MKRRPLPIAFLCPLAVAALLLPRPAVATPAGFEAVEFGARVQSVSSSAPFLPPRLAAVLARGLAAPQPSGLGREGRLSSDADALAIPSDKLPSNSTIRFGNPIDAAAADSGAFNQFHKQSYTAAGMTEGYLQGLEYALSANPNGKTAEGDWQASVYTSADAATVMVNDALTAMSLLGYSDVGCPYQSCHAFVFNGTIDGQLSTIGYVVFSVQNTLGEVYIDSPPTTNTAASNEFAANIGGTADAGHAVLQAYTSGARPTAQPTQTPARQTATPLPPTATATPQPTATTTPTATPQPQPSVAVMNLTLSHRMKNRMRQTRALTSGEKGVFTATAQLVNGNGATGSATIGFTVNGKRSGAVTSMTISQASTDSVTFVASRKFSARKTEHVTAEVIVTFAQASDRRSLSFTVKPKKVKR